MTLGELVERLDCLCWAGVSLSTEVDCRPFDWHDDGYEGTSPAHTPRCVELDLRGRSGAVVVIST